MVQFLCGALASVHACLGEQLVGQFITVSSGANDGVIARAVGAVVVCGAP